LQPISGNLSQPSTAHLFSFFFLLSFIASLCACVAWAKQCPLQPVTGNSSQPSTTHLFFSFFCRLLHPSGVIASHGPSNFPCYPLLQPSTIHLFPSHVSAMHLLQVKQLKIIHSFVLAGNVADMSATCRPDSQMSALLADTALSCRHKIDPDTTFSCRGCWFPCLGHQLEPY
jgi:hypothetical protein